MSDIKKEIVENWDKDFAVLAGESFASEWLDDPQRVAQIERFLVTINGWVMDATHHLIGDNRESEVDRIQQENKDRIWLASLGPFLSPTFERSLESIRFQQRVLTVHKIGNE